MPKGKKKGGNRIGRVRGAGGRFVRKIRGGRKRRRS